MLRPITVAVLTCSLLAVILPQVVLAGGANADQPEVEAVLAEIRELIIDHYNAPPASKRKTPSPEDLAEADLLDDIRYTVEQAQEILADMKRMWGYEVSEPRIHPNTSYFWKMPIYYVFNENSSYYPVHSDEEKDIIRYGFEYWNNYTCVHLVERTEESLLENEHHLFIIRGSGCWSYVGQVFRPRQELSMGEGCFRSATAAHEAGHALGVSHEQARPDRDKHVEIIWENIVADKEHNFIMKADWDPAKTQYDISSTMQYHSLSFSVDSKAKLRTLMPFDIYQLGGMGQRARLQFNDIKRVNYAYNCIASLCKPSQLTVRACYHGGYQDPKNCAVCRCPSGTFGDDCSQTEPPMGPGMTDECGDLFLKACQIKALTIPTYPEPYGEDSSCTWRIKTDAKGLIFAFEDQPDMPCASSDNCYDFVEIRTNMKDLSIPGKYFCKCGVNQGRVVKIDGDEALVRWASTTLEQRGGAGKSSGFILNVYATCNDTLASEVVNSCSLTSSGYESCSGVSLPLCDAAEIDFYDPPTKKRRPRKQFAH